MDLDPRDLLQALLLFDGSYEAHVLRLLERLLPSGGYLVDVGANIGLHSLVGARRVGPAGRVDAIEPEPFSRGRLESHVKLNGLQNVTAFAYALSDARGTAVLHLSPTENLAKSSLRAANVTMGLGSPSPGTVTVETRTLDEHISNARRMPDVLKIDVEGAELLVVSGGLVSLSKNNSAAILFEASDLQTAPFGHTTRDVKRKLVELGYGVFRYRSDKLEAVSVEESHRLEDLVALKPLHHEQLRSGTESNLLGLPR
jgi:FkbM family methyltransferase